MAEAKKEDEVVTIEDDGVVVVDVSDNPELADKKDGDDAETSFAEIKEAATGKAEKRTRTKAAEEASEALTKALQTAEQEREAEKKRREAAEATAIAERTAREAANRAAENAKQEAKGFREQAESRELASVTTGMENATQRMQAAKAELKRAYEAADFEKVADAQEHLSLAAADLKDFSNKKTDIESGARKVPSHEGRVEAPLASSAFEQYVSTFSPRSQSWLRSHPDCVPANVGGNPVKNNAMMAGHYVALSKGLQPDSDEYYKAIEENLGYREAAPDQAAIAKTPVSAAAEIVPATSKRPTPQPSAPVSREPPSASGQQRTSRSVTLTADQQDAAKLSFPHLTPQKAYTEYAKNLLELEAEGKMGRLTH